MKKQIQKNNATMHEKRMNSVENKLTLKLKQMFSTPNQEEKYDPEFNTKIKSRLS